MRYTDIAIIGGGLAGSTAAAMLGRAGISAVLIDPHPVYPFDFRVEKISGDEQLARFRRPGSPNRCCDRQPVTDVNWIARFGRLLDKAPKPNNTASCTTRFVNAVRAEIRAPAEMVFAKAIAHSKPSDDRQTITLSDGEADLRTARRARQRAQRRPAPHARHRTHRSSAAAIRSRSASTSSPSAAPPSTFRR